MFLLFVVGVPLSTQWGPQGYFYAIQIAQYGLSHYSKNLTERAPHVEIYDTAEEKDSRATAPWSAPKGCSLNRVHDKSRSTSVRQFNAPGMWFFHFPIVPEGSQLICGRLDMQPSGEDDELCELPPQGENSGSCGSR